MSPGFSDRRSSARTRRTFPNRAHGSQAAPSGSATARASPSERSARGQARPWAGHQYARGALTDDRSRLRGSPSTGLRGEEPPCVLYTSTYIHSRGARSPRFSLMSNVDDFHRRLGRRLRRCQRCRLHRLQSARASPPERSGRGEYAAGSVRADRGASAPQIGHFQASNHRGPLSCAPP